MFEETSTPLVFQEWEGGAKIRQDRKAKDILIPIEINVSKENSLYFLSVSSHRKILNFLAQNN